MTIKIKHLFIILSLLFTCNKSNSKFEGNITVKSDTLDHLDTLLIKDNYIVLGDKKWEIDLVLDNSKRIISKRDTLYYNYDSFSPCLLLGKEEYLDKIKLLRKYSPQHEFSDYKVKFVYKGPFAKPNFKTNPKWKLYRTKINESAKGEPDIAGHYWICGWCCGSNCQSFVLVDCITGEIFDGLDDIEFEENKVSNLWECYPDSKMLIINNNNLVKGKYYDLLGEYFLCGNTEIYIWENRKFTRLE